MLQNQFEQELIETRIAALEQELRPFCLPPMCADDFSSPERYLGFLVELKRHKDLDDNLWRKCVRWD